MAFNRPSIAKNDVRSPFNHQCNHHSIAVQSVSIALPQSPPYPLVRLKALARAFRPGFEPGCAGAPLAFKPSR
jgi:hypothetical protein